MTDLTNALLAALSSLPACTAVSFAREEKSLPIVTVSDENASVFAQADGLPYLEEHHAEIGVFAAGREEMSALAQAADALLTALGLRLTSAAEAFDEELFAWRKTLRYRCLLHENTIYPS